jgi:hypothetical protein
MSHFVHLLFSSFKYSDCTGEKHTTKALISIISGATTISITTFSITTFSITTFSIMTLSIKGLYVTLSISGTQHNKDLILCWVSLCWMWHFIYFYSECRHAKCRYAECRYAECRYVECRGAINSTLSLVLVIAQRCLSVFSLSPFSFYISLSFFHSLLASLIQCSLTFS